MIFIDRSDMQRVAATLRAWADDLDRRLSDAKYDRISVDGDYADAVAAMPTVAHRKVILKTLGVRVRR